MFLSSGYFDILERRMGDLGEARGVMSGGGRMMGHMGLLIGLVLLVSGLVLLYASYDLKVVYGFYRELGCGNGMGDGKCTIHVTYAVGQTAYSKLVETSKEEIGKLTNPIKLYYSKSNPEYVLLHAPNYLNYGLGCVGLGLVCIGVWAWGE